MDKRIYRFLAGTLGNDGAKALERAVTKQPEIASYLLPRVVLGWVSMQKSGEYEGEIPGVDDSYCSFTKTDQGFSGSITNTEGLLKFHDQDSYNLAATIALALGFEAEPFKGTDNALYRLGKSIDALLKAHEITNQLTEKTELPGRTAAPQQQQAPAEPESPQKQPPMARNKPKLPKLPTLKVEKSEAGRECPDCGGTRFRDDKFVGCLCWRDLAKSVRTTVYMDGYVLEFTKEADRDFVAALTQEFK
jgi:hypothetical protein